MRKWTVTAAALIALTSGPLTAQSASEGSYIANASQRQQSGPPVVGLRREGDGIAVMVTFTSDTRDATARRDEIFSMIQGALTRASGAGVELVTGSPVLRPVTQENYKELNLVYAGREDTNQTTIMVALPLAANSEKRVDDFVKSLPRKGRGTIARSPGRLLTIRNPQQYRPAIVKLIADDVQANSQLFGPDYRAHVTGLDEAVQWTQLNDREVFLYLPYKYTIVAYGAGESAE